MAVDSKGKFVPSVKVNTNASLPITRVSATATKTAFKMDGTRTLFGFLNVHAFLATALTGTHNDIVYVQRAPGAANVTITYVVSGNSTPLSVSVSTTNITIYVATNSSGVATSTGTQVLAAVRAKIAAWSLVYAELAPSNDGTGVVTALTQTALGDVVGTNPTLDVVLESSIDDGTTYPFTWAFTQVTAVADTNKQKIIGPAGPLAHWKLTLGGTASPVFYVSITAKYQQSF